MIHDAPGGFTAEGTLTGHISVESRGTTPAALMQRLQGEAEAGIRNGAVGGRLATALVRAAPSAAGTALVLSRGSTPFDAATAEATITDGRATLANSWIAWPTARATLAGTVDIADQRADVTAATRGTETSDPTAFYALTGPWRALHVKPTRPPS